MAKDLCLMRSFFLSPSSTLHCSPSVEEKLLPELLQLSATLPPSIPLSSALRTPWLQTAPFFPNSPPRKTPFQPIRPKREGTGSNGILLTTQHSTCTIK